MAIIKPDKYFPGYWELKAKILEVTICRKCGMPLDDNYKKRRRGKLCLTCYIKEAMEVKRLFTHLLDIDTL
jgi:protein-arginine kinase activator protein McsA